METAVITNFTGSLTRREKGDMDSGLAKYSQTFGNDPFSNPGNLTWLEQATRIDSDEDVITDLIMAARPRLESGVTYVYAVGHTGRLYKIQVNNPGTFNPDFDNPVLLTTLTDESPTFKYGASIQFYGSTEKIFIGHDKGVTKVDFDGTDEAFIGATGSYTANVPRPSVQFVGKLYFGNGDNLVEIDSTETVISYSKLDPAFPSGTQVRDIDVSPDGNYAQIVVSRVAQADMTVITQDTASLSSADSYFMYWNGTDDGVTSYNPYNAYSLNANTAFGPFSYTMGYDLGGAALYSQKQKIISLPNSVSPNFAAMFSTGNLVGFGAPEQDSSVLKGSLLVYGQYDIEIPPGLFRLLRLTATTQTDVQQMPVCLVVSNLFFGASSAGYSSNKIGSAKIYFSTLETDDSPTTKYKLYKFTTVPTGSGTAIAGVYETQTELFLQKISVKEVRLYTAPLVANNEFDIDFIGSNKDVITNSNNTFTVGSNVTAGDDLIRYSPDIEPTYALGLRITNSGSANWTLKKIEIDYEFVKS